MLDALNYLATETLTWAPSNEGGSPYNEDGDLKAAIKLTAYAAAVEKFVTNHYTEVMVKVEQLKAETAKREKEEKEERAHAKLHTPSNFLVRGAKGLANLTTLRQRNQGLRHQQKK